MSSEWGELISEAGGIILTYLICHSLCTDTLWAAIKMSATIITTEGETLLDD